MQAKGAPTIPHIELIAMPDVEGPLGAAQVLLVRVVRVAFDSPLGPVRNVSRMPEKQTGSPGPLVRSHHRDRSCVIWTDSEGKG